MVLAVGCHRNIIGILKGKEPLQGIAGVLFVGGACLEKFPPVRLAAGALCPPGSPLLRRRKKKSRYCLRISVGVCPYSLLKLALNFFWLVKPFFSMISETGMSVCNKSW